MGRYIKTIVILSNLPAAAGVYWYGRAVRHLLPEEAVALLDGDHVWLGLAAFLYVVNFVLAWRFRDVFAVSAARMLAFAVIAYLGISHGVDIVGLNYEIMSDVLAGGESVDPSIIVLRARLGAAAVMLAMGLTCIAVGFESREDRDGQDALQP